MLPWRYINMEVAPGRSRRRRARRRAMGFRGFNCSLPHKVAVIQHLDGLGESAAVMGAVNSVVRRGDQLIGENTDGKGLSASRSPRSSIRKGNRSCCLAPAGQPARLPSSSPCQASRSWCSSIARKRGNELFQLLRDKLNLDVELVIWHGDYKIPAGTDIVINATSIGLYDAEARLNLNIATLRPAMVAAE